MTYSLNNEQRKRNQLYNGTFTYLFCVYFLKFLLKYFIIITGKMGHKGDSGAVGPPGKSKRIAQDHTIYQIKPPVNQNVLHNTVHWLHWKDKLIAQYSTS